MANKIFVDSNQVPLYFIASTGIIDSSMPTGVMATASWDQLPNGSGWASSRYDFGPPPRCSIFNWRAYLVSDNSGTATAGSTVDLYLATSDSTGTNFGDGSIPSGDAVVTSADRKRNLQFIGSVQIDATNNLGLNKNKYSTSGLCYIYSRYASVILWNGSGSALASGNFVSFSAAPDEIQ